MKTTILEFSDYSGGKEKIIDSIIADLNDTEIANNFYHVLPIKFQICYWGKSLWGQVLLDEFENENFADSCNEGEIAYWPDGKQIHLYFGPTPASDGSKPKPPGKIVKLGLLKEGIDKLEKILNSLPERFANIKFKQEYF